MNMKKDLLIQVHCNEYKYESGLIKKWANEFYSLLSYDRSTCISTINFKEKVIKIHSKLKFQKRIINRQRLYEKRKRLGRSL